MLFDCLGLHFLHPALDRDLCRTLGVQTLDAQQLLDIGQELAKQLAANDFVKVAHWLACMHSVLDDLNMDETVLERLREMQIIPASSGEFVSISSGSIFFPISQDTAKAAKQKSEWLVASLF
jgi:hypothetical protein